MKHILFTGGIGDVIALLSMMTEDEIKGIVSCYWATRASKVCIGMFKASPALRHIKHHEVLTDGKTYYQMSEVAERIDVPADLEDWSIMVKFGEWHKRPYRKCPLLTDPLPDLTKFALPPRYVLVQDQTPDNMPVERAAREIYATEWTKIIERLEAEKKIAVVVNSPKARPAPKHARVIDLIGVTTFTESLGLLRTATDYWGIASSLAVAACQIHSPEHLWIKAVEPWFFQNKFIYNCPHKTFPFLHKSFCAPAIPEVSFISKDMKTKQVVMTCARIVQNNIVGCGSVVELPIEDADRYIKAKQAEEFDPSLHKKYGALETPENKVAVKRTRKKAVRFE